MNQVRRIFMYDCYMKEECMNEGMATARVELNELTFRTLPVTIYTTCCSIKKICILPQKVFMCSLRFPQ